jgi:DNA-binding LacI/PurR family transcriptional regulator
VIVANTDHMRDEEVHFCESLIRRPVDGALMVPYHLTDDELDHLMVRSGVAVAVVGQHVQHPQVDVAFGNDGAAAHATISWLIAEKGHRRIAFIGVTDNFSAGARRRKAFVEAIQVAGLELPAEYMQVGDWSPPSGERAMTALLSLPAPPTAVFVCNDLMAIGALEAVRNRGLRIPEDVAVVGFDDIPVASWVRPRLTTVAQFPGEMGEALAAALFERIDGAYSGPGRRYEVPCRLVEREST